MSKKVEALIIGIMCFILTAGIVVQIKTVENNGTTLGRSQQESELKDQVLKMKEKYDNAYEELNKAEKKLEEVRQGATNNNYELENLEKKIKDANILLGATEVTGQGVIVTVEDGKETQTTLAPEDLLIHDADILSIINELKNAGAEAIDVNGQRIVNTTSVSCDGNVVTVNGEKVSSPFVISAIGLPEQMATLNRPGGYLERLRSWGIKADLQKAKKITIPKYTGVISFKTAKDS